MIQVSPQIQFLMKKLFTLLAVLLASVSMTQAQTAVTLNNGIARPHQTLANMSVKKQATATVAPRTAEHYWPTSEYRSLGKGSMTDEMVTAIYQYKPVTFEVEIQQCVAEPAFYRVIAPYGQAFADAMLQTNGLKLKEDQYDAEGKCVINIDLTDPNDGYMPKSMIGCDWGHGEMYIGLPTTGCLIFSDGVITAPRRGIAVGDDEGATAQNVNQQFRIVLPGATPTDYRLELSDCSNCLTSRTFEASILVGNDIDKVKYYVFPDQMEDEMTDLLKLVASDGPVFTPRGAFSYEMDMVNKETLVLVGLDKAGNTVANKWFSYYYVNDDTPDDWQSVGTATLTDGVLRSIYNVENASSECEMQQHKYRPGYLRLVNPYNNNPYAQDRYLHKGHDHYIYIVADDPEGIYLEESPIGLDFGHGVCRIWSQCGYWLAAGEAFEDLKDMELCSTVVDGKISFADEQLLFSAMNHENGDWYMTPGGTEIALPEGFTLGVGSIIADDDLSAPVMLYNLNGQPVDADNAAPGLYIRRQGSRVAKVVIR